MVPGWSIAALPLRYKLFLAYGLVLTLSLLSAYSIVYFSLHRSITENIELELEETARAVQGMVHAQARLSVRNYLRGLAEMHHTLVARLHWRHYNGELTLQEAQSEARRMLLQQTIGASGYFYVLDSQARTVVHPNPDFQMQDVSDYEFAQIILSRTSSYLEYDWQNPGEPELRGKGAYVEYFEPWDWYIAASVYRDEYTQLLHTEDFRQSISALNPGPGGVLLVLDARGRALVGPEGSELLAPRDPEATAVLEIMVEQREGRLVHTWREPGDARPLERLLIFKHIPELDWIVVTGVSVAEQQKPLQLLQIFTALTLGLSLLLMLPLSYLVGEYITRPLQGLITKFEKGAKGDLSVRAPLGAPDEMGRLSAYFNEFMARLEAYGRALRESEERYRTAMESTPDPLLVYDMQGRVTYCNPAFTRVFGWSLEELLGVRLDFLPPDREPEAERFLAAVRAEQSVHGLATRRLTKGHEPREVIMSGALFHGREGKPIGLVVSLKDVTDHKRAEAALKQAEDEQRERLERQVRERTAELQHINRELVLAKEAAERATATKSEFLASVSHEIRTPLNGIIGATDLALHEAAGPKLRRFLEIIHSSAASLLAIIEDILDFSKIEAGRLELEEQRFALPTLLRELKDFFAPKAAEKRLELLFFMDPALPAALLGDALRLKQVLTNLVSNAVKFTDPWGNIVVGGRLLEQHGAELVLEFYVRDNGVGIPLDKQTGLFQPFTQADASTTRKYGGTGLGLSISKRLVELMGGDITLHSEPGAGSTFSFRVRMQSAEATERPAQSDPVLQGKRILVVDDSAPSRMVALTLLGALGMHPETVETSEQALELLRRSLRGELPPFHCLLADWRMPGMDGLELARAVRNELRAELPIVIVTAYSEDKEIMDAELPQVDGVLGKPYLLETLGEALRRVLCMCERRATEPAPEPARLDAAPLRGLRVLVAEDNPTNQEIAAAILQDADIRVAQARTGLEAWDLVREQGPEGFDAVLVDLQMPELDGLELAQRIRKTPQYAGLPLIAITADVRPETREACRNAGMDGFVSKPFAREGLLAALIEHSRGLRLPEVKAPTRRPLRLDRPECPPPILSPSLRRLLGVDVQEALCRLGLTEERYLRILHKFRRSNLETLAQMQRALEQGDLEELRLQAHALKGGAANIGAWPVQLAAAELELALERLAQTPEAPVPPDLPLLLERLANVLPPLLEALGALQEPPPPSTGQPSGDTAPLLADLEAALHAARPVSVATAVERLLALHASPQLQRLAELAEDYEYEAALQLLPLVVAELQSGQAPRG